MKSATNHLLVITGKPRTGKTTELIGLVEDAVESPSSHVAFLFADKPIIEQLPRKCVLMQYQPSACPIQAFLDAADDKVKNFTHVFIDDASHAQTSAILRFAQNFPQINIAVSMN